MRLIGQYDSPFVRRVGVALQWYGIAYEHLPWSVWADADRLSAENPLRRVPTLEFDDGSTVTDSGSILEIIDDQLALREGSDSARLLLPRSGPTRWAGLRVAALATGIADKAVSLFYEPLLRTTPSTQWMDRCRVQILETLARLEGERSQIASHFWLGPQLSHADVAIACMLRFTREAHPALGLDQRFPALTSLAAQCEALQPFQQVQQSLTVAVSR